MMQIYGSPLSPPTNKVRYTANFLQLSYEFNVINLGAGEHRTPEFLKINPLGKIPCIKDGDGFLLAESNAIIRYLASKQQSAIYPVALKPRAVIDQWIDYASQHVLVALAKIMFNTYFYKFINTERDERSLQDGQKFIAQYLPVLEQQLSQHRFIAGETFSLADIALVAALDTAELCHIDLSVYSHLDAWRKKLMAEPFYTAVHSNYAESFNTIMKAREKVS